MKLQLNGNQPTSNFAIFRIYLKPDIINPEVDTGFCCCSNPHKRINYKIYILQTRILYAHLGKFHRERTRVILRGTNRFVGNEPHVAPVVKIRPAISRPPFHICFIHVRNPVPHFIDLCISVLRKMKDELVIVVMEPVAVNRLIVTVCHVPDRDGLDPVYDILKPEKFRKRCRNTKGNPRVCQSPTNVQVERAPVF